ncbi:mannosyl-oligosaccharide glucosidase isoform X3 [Amyelois transitella]|uniref:mannosyl-oligosaccharide glucosidase isoform X1 n=1 Tax=Amyelois transitella TaxID=680683 RepID=UPI00299054CC|nr:mannosyl-oligosaccharide glucosidase isoform X1 [Amyelois transitella]XP_060809206.1 mannosyl-oligosaccharide glucosidase isoform X2 [Amyelois transitella]XP_060809207.1 mannosyl-oligosaccharide glucosidase isoform X3 [Amyelois transitella]
MVRHRKVGNVQYKHVNSNETSSSSGSSENSTVGKAFKILSIWKTMVGFFCFMIAVYVGTLGYLETRVNTPLDDEKVVQESGLAIPDRYWGTYRPGVYMGMKSREPRSPVFGLMWYELTASSRKGIRHWCDQGDNLASYGWLRHDGVSFGEQLILDHPHNITTSFIKTPGGEHGGHWTVRISVNAENNANLPFVLIWYGALDESLGPAAPHSRLWIENGQLLGHTPQLHNFKVALVPHKGKVIHKSYSEAYSSGLHVLKEKLHSLLKAERHATLGRLTSLRPDPELDDKEKDVNFVPIQLMVETPFVLDVVYSTEDLPTPPLKGEEYTRVLDEKRRSFDEEFEEKFKLSEKGYQESDIAIARAAMSNMIGGIGYFYGAGRVQSQYTREPVPYWRAPLYTAVPSRSFFPRGFLWDEGFHGLLIGRWNSDIQMDIAAHWLDLINVEGWIPREQILGAEALARVPKEFVVQNNAAANPPMLLLQLARLVKTRPHLFEPYAPHRKTLDRMFSRLQAWYQWFQSTQKGEEPTSYRWRGREDTGDQLNPKTLTSGIDDYPRASHPSNIERHVDLRCWMYAAADSMAVIADALNRDTSKFEATRDQLSDEDLLNELHWSPHTQTYADYGLHTDGVRLVRKQPRNPGEQPKVVRSVSVPPQPRLVTSAFGYVSLFPMLLKVLRPESDKLGKILEDLDKPDLLWSPYGLRSLSKSSPLYMKRNTEHDPPYWRGQVWINVNYLALSALKHYSAADGPHKERAGQLHARLSANIVRNILSEYRRTGYLWEQYSSEDGRGSGCRPFTGWTALVTLIMADEY